MEFPYYTPNEDFYHLEDGKKQCRRCYHRLPKSAFNRQSGRPDGLYSYCRDCFRAYRAELSEGRRRDDFARMVNAAMLCKKDRAAVEWAGKIIQRFGGLEKSVDFVYQAVTEAAKSPTPRRSVIELFHLVYRIMLVGQGQPVDLEQLQAEVPPATVEESAETNVDAGPA